MSDIVDELDKIEKCEMPFDILSAVSSLEGKYELEPLGEDLNNDWQKIREKLAQDSVKVDVINRLLSGEGDVVDRKDFLEYSRDRLREARREISRTRNPVEKVRAAGRAVRDISAEGTKRLKKFIKEF